MIQETSVRVMTVFSAVLPISNPADPPAAATTDTVADLAMSMHVVKPGTQMSARDQVMSNAALRKK